MTLKERFKNNPQLYYALSIAATWAGIGSLMNGVTMTQTYGIIPSLIWVLGNTVACILFGAAACKIPKVREVFRLSDFSREEFLAMMTDGVTGYSRAAIYKKT